MLPKFSILMAVYRNDRLDHFEEAIRSVLTQTVLADEIVIVRDGPVAVEMQSALDQLKRDKAARFTVIDIDRNGGLAAALNIGLEACRNEIVVRQDADDISVPWRFEKQVQFLSAHPEVALVSAWYDQYDFDMTRVTSVRPVPETNQAIIRFGRFRTPVNHACAVFRKSAVTEVGGYPSVNGLCEDWWLALRLVKASKQMYNLQESLVRVRGGSDFYFRRRGLKYLRQEVINLAAMRREGLMRTTDVLANLFVRTPSRLVPGWILELFYRYGIRKL